MSEILPVPLIRHNNPVLEEFGKSADRFFGYSAHYVRFLKMVVGVINYNMDL